MAITLTVEEYEALVSLARESATTTERLREINDYVKFLDKKNNIVRRVLWVQWQESGTPLPATTRFPETWPPEMRAKIERTDRNIARLDVEEVLTARAIRPVSVLVTPDPAAILGWSKIDDYFRNP